MGELAGRTILLVDEAAVSMALSPGRLEAAGLDVQLHEPPDPANPLLSPHDATAPLECNETTSIRAARICWSCSMACSIPVTSSTRRQCRTAATPEIFGPQLGSFG